MLAEDQPDDRREDVPHECGDHSAKGRADDHGHGEVDSVAAQQEGLEISQHAGSFARLISDHA